jgi:hypothetical protein
MDARGVRGRVMRTKVKTFFSDPCVRITSGIFGFLFLLAVLFVPCTKTVTTVRPDPSGYFETKTTVHTSAYLFLPEYLARRSRSGQGPEAIRTKSLQWTAAMAVVVILGVFDTALVCLLFRKKRRTADGEGDAENDGPGEESGGGSGFGLLR